MRWFRKKTNKLNPDNLIILSQNKLYRSTRIVPPSVAKELYKERKKRYKQGRINVKN